MNFQRLLFLSTVFLFAFSSCKKEANSNDTLPDASLAGTWELAYTFGGMMPPTTYAPGNGSLIRFDDRNYQMIHGGQVVHEGTYTLKRDSTVDVNSCTLLPPKSAATNRIVSDSSNGLRMYYEINGNLLKLTSGCIPADGGGSLYRRKSGD